jgi:Domain of unknown function (DUF4157)
VRARRLSPEAEAAFRHVPAIDRQRARVLVVRWLTPGVSAMTIGRWIFVRSGHELDAGLIAHELVHVEQWRVHHAVPFLVRYLGEYLRGRAHGLRHWAAYAAISFEADARARAGS